MERDLEITWCQEINMFKVFANDRKPILQGPTVEEIKNKGWFAASDGHSGVYAIVCAPKAAQSELEKIFNGI